MSQHPCRASLWNHLSIADRDSASMYMQSIHALSKACMHCRAIVTAHSCLVFEPNNAQSKKFLECVTPRLTANEGARVLAEYRRNHDDYEEGENEQPPFELEMVEGALMVATGAYQLELLHLECNPVPHVLCTETARNYVLPQPWPTRLGKSRVP